jgi:peptide deformylase
MTTDEKKRLTLFINPDILKHARAQAVVEECCLTTLIEKALTKYLPQKTVIKKVDMKKDE